MWEDDDGDDEADEVWAFEKEVEEREEEDDVIAWTLEKEEEGVKGAILERKDDICPIRLVELLRESKFFLVFALYWWR